jgi:hypothetical protein
MSALISCRKQRTALKFLLLWDEYQKTYYASIPTAR